MTNIVEYILGLRSEQFQAGMGKAIESTEGLKSTLESTSGMLKTIGIGLAIFEGAEFIHESVEQFHALEQATAKVSANLKANGEAAGLGMEQVEEMATAMHTKVQFSKAEIMDMQSQLLTFPKITKETFEESMGLVADLAKQTGHGLSETAIMFGKAFGDDKASDGLKRLQRYGVLFTADQKEMISTLSESGHNIEAQKYMLKSLAEDGYKGVAEAMANADPEFAFKVLMDDTRESIGNTAMDIVKDLMPSLQSLAEYFKAGAKWVHEHEDSLISIGKAVISAYLAFKTFALVGGLMEGVTTAFAFFTAEAPEVVGAETEIAVGFEAMLGPIGLVATAIVGIVALFSSVNDAQKEFENKTTKNAEGNYLKSVIDNNKKFGHDEKYSINQVQKELDDEGLALQKKKKKIDNTAPSTLGTVFGYDNMHDDREQLEKEQADYELKKEGLKSALAERNKKETKQPALAPKVKDLSEEKDKDSIHPKSTKFDKAEGRKSVTINVSIKDLIGTQTLNITNIKEGAEKVKNVVLEALTGAINDFQIVAGQ